MGFKRNQILLFIEHYTLSNSYLYNRIMANGWAGFVQGIRKTDTTYEIGYRKFKKVLDFPTPLSHRLIDAFFI